MNYKIDRPIVLISGFKAGTWLTRKILTGITGLPFYEPPVIPGKDKYFDPGQLNFMPGHYYSWHLVPVEQVRRALNHNQARTIFIVRNIYDVVVSIYFHFIKNVDADINRGANKHTFLENFTFKEGISLIITGFDEPGARWNGMAEILTHYCEIFKAGIECQSIIIDYDKMVQEKASTIKQISNFIDFNLSESALTDLVHQTDFDIMKKSARQNNSGVSHFRAGKPMVNRNELSPYHVIQLRQMINLITPKLCHYAAEANMQSIVKL